MWVKLTSPHAIEGPVPPMAERVKQKIPVFISKGKIQPNLVQENVWQRKFGVKQILGQKQIFFQNKFWIKQTFHLSATIRFLVSSSSSLFIVHIDGTLWIIKVI